jgi:hypothetical protein
VVKPIQLMIAGAPKAGTTSLLRYLAQHPDICTHPQREMTFFLNDAQYHQGYEEAFSRYFRSCYNNESVLIAKDVMAMYSSEVVKRLYEHNPHMQVVLLLRNPVDLAYSSYWYSRRRGWENIKTFEEAINTEAGRLQGDWVRWRKNAYLDNGLYIRHIETQFHCFERDQVSLFLTDDLKNSSEVCRTIFEKLNINSSLTIDINRVHNYAKKARSELLARAFYGFLVARNPLQRVMRRLIPTSISYKMRYALLWLNEKEFKQPPMQPETRARLVEYFRPYNKELSEFLGRDLSHWNR